jgi:hypothetical protein
MQNLRTIEYFFGQTGVAKLIYGEEFEYFCDFGQQTKIQNPRTTFSGKEVMTILAGRPSVTPKKCAPTHSP